MIRAAAITILLASSIAVAQDASTPTTQPATQPMPADQLLDQMLRGAGPAAKPLQPVPGGQTTDVSSKSAVAPNAPQTALIREGDYIHNRTGRLGKVGDGYEFVFDSDGRAMQDPPVLILPNLKLMAMENAVSSASRDLRFEITGAVTEYKGRNYVLLERVVVVPDVRKQF